MNKQVMLGVGVSLLVIAVLIFVFTRSMGGSDAASLSKEMPKPRAGDPTFAPDTASGGGRGAVGRSTSSAPTASHNGSDGAATAPPP